MKRSFICQIIRQSSFLAVKTGSVPKHVFCHGPKYASANKMAKVNLADKTSYSQRGSGDGDNKSAHLLGSDNTGPKDKDQFPKLTFVSQVNPVTGKMDWVVQDEDYDFVQEIARSGYADMLHDKDRNEKYYKALHQAVKLLKERNKKVKVLDIGTGTGLLSMMASTAGADSVAACEAFPPMASCARKVMAANGFQDKIKLIPKRSTEVLLDDMDERANLLVTELFDTELIGEGAIGSYTDAHDRLMEEDCVAVPTTGIMYVQAVQGDVLKKWNSLQPIQLPNGTAISPPDSFTQCHGTPSLHDLQVDQLEGHLKFISKPVEVFRFDFSRRKALKKRESGMQFTSALQDGRVDAFVMWWDLVMDPQGDIILSCGPCWTRREEEQVPWRDHWMQALYYPSSSLQVKAGQQFEIHSCHDEYSLWFETSPKDNISPLCTCGLHVAMSRSRVGQINEQSRNDKFLKVLQQQVTKDTICLVISDGSLLPLFAASLGAKKVFYLDSSWSCRKVMKELIEHNNLQGQICVLEKNAEDITEEDLECLKIDLVIAEPFFQAAHLPWEHLFFWYAINSMRAHLSSEVTILPRSMTVHAIAVQFKDLHKIRAPVGNCEGFDISEFDKLIEDSSVAADEEIEPHPLWEYPCRALSSPVTVASLDFSSARDQVGKWEKTIPLQCCREGTMNGIVYWTEYNFGSGVSISTGLASEITTEGKLSWDMFSRQGVKLLKHGRQINTDSQVVIQAKFTPENGDFSFVIE